MFGQILEIFTDKCQRKICAEFAFRLCVALRYRTTVKYNIQNKTNEFKIYWQRLLTRQEESLIHCRLFSKSDMAEIFLAFTYSCDIATLSKDLHDELLCGVFRQTTNKHRLTSWGAFSCGWRGEVCSEVIGEKKKSISAHMRHPAFSNC